MEIQKVNTEKATYIIGNPNLKENEGLFLIDEGEIYVAIDNSDGNAWTEEFRSERAAIDYLKGKEVIE